MTIRGAAMQWLRTVSGLTMALMVVFALAIAFWAGLFYSHFELDLCYSNAMQTLAREAQYARTHAQFSATFDSLIMRLPLEGYETNCDRVAATIEAARPADLKD